MGSHTLEVLGVEVSFKAEADPRRVERARDLINDRYRRLTEHGGHLSKEKLLTFLALALADDVIQLQDEKDKTGNKLKELLVNIEKKSG